MQKYNFRLSAFSLSFLFGTPATRAAYPLDLSRWDVETDVELERYRMLACLRI